MEKGNDLTNVKVFIQGKEIETIPLTYESMTDTYLASKYPFELEGIQDALKKVGDINTELAIEYALSHAISLNDAIVKLYIK